MYIKYIHIHILNVTSLSLSIYIHKCIHIYTYFSRAITPIPKSPSTDFQASSLKPEFEALGKHVDGPPDGYVGERHMHGM